MLLHILLLLMLGSLVQSTVYLNPLPANGSRLAPHVHYPSFQTRSTPNRIIATYVGTPPDSATQSAIQFALSLLDTSFQLTHDVNVAIRWIDLSSIPGLLADAGPTQMCQHPDSTNFRYVLIPTSLYAQLIGSPCPGASSSAHVSINVNSNPPTPWYTGTDGNPPPSTVDLVTVMMHEAVHGLGFLTGVANGNGNYLYAPYGLFYDWFVFGGRPGWPSHYGLPVQNPCLASPGTLTNNLLYFRGNVGDPSVANFQVYAPSTFQIGSSISHVNPSGDTTNRLMFPSLSAGEAQHDIGGNVWAAMANFGYPMSPVAQYATSTTGTSTCLPTCSGIRLDSFLFDS